jgi:uncharacterized membrane protein
MCLEYAVLSGQTRGEGTSRIEAFSDGVFAFALTLLVVSLEAPRSYDELLATMRGFPAFGACFAILIWIWVEHYRFFRAYRIADGVTILLNSLLLFVVLFYVYPLKFMFTFLSHMFFGIAPPRDRLATFGMSVERSVDLLLIYGLGFIAIFAVFTLLHWRVQSQADALALSVAERRQARIGLRTHLLSAIVGMVSVGLVLTLPPHRIGLAGMFYAVLGPLHAWHAWWSRRAILESA